MQAEGHLPPCRFELDKLAPAGLVTGRVIPVGEAVVPAVPRWPRMHVVRGFSAEKDAQGGHISAESRINERIRVPEVRLVGPNGEQVGIVAIGDALRLAQEADLDLVEVAPTARPPVCKLMDYGKFKYESALKAREARKNQAQTIIKEIKLRPKIDPHDYGTKKGHVERFLKQGDKVKVTIMFRGREQSRPELGFRLLRRLAEDVGELGFVEAQPRQDGRNMTMVIGPHRRKSDTSRDRSGRSGDSGHAERPAEGRPAARPAEARSGEGRGADGRGAERRQDRAPERSAAQSGAAQGGAAPGGAAPGGAAQGGAAPGGGPVPRPRRNPTAPAGA